MRPSSSSCRSRNSSTADSLLRANSITSRRPSLSTSRRPRQHPPQRLLSQVRVAVEDLREMALGGGQQAHPLQRSRVPPPAAPSGPPAPRRELPSGSSQARAKHHAVQVGLRILDEVPVVRAPGTVLLGHLLQGLGVVLLHERVFVQAEQELLQGLPHLAGERIPPGRRQPGLHHRQQIPSPADGGEAAVDVHQTPGVLPLVGHQGGQQVHQTTLVDTLLQGGHRRPVQPATGVSGGQGLGQGRYRHSASPPPPGGRAPAP